MARWGRNARGQVNRVWWCPAGTTTETNGVMASTDLPFGSLCSRTFGNARTLDTTHDHDDWIDAVDGTSSGLSLAIGTGEVGIIVGLTVGAAANERVCDADADFAACLLMARAAHRDRSRFLTFDAGAARLPGRKMPK